MKSHTRGIVIVSCLVLMILGSTLLVTFASAEESASNSGFVGIKGPAFSFGVVEAASGVPVTGVDIADNTPWAITGFYMYSFEGGIYIWVSSASKVALALGATPGQIFQVFCSKEQVSRLKVGDWVQITGITARDQLVRVADIVQAAPFTY